MRLERLYKISTKLYREGNLAVPASVGRWPSPAATLGPWLHDVVGLPALGVLPRFKPARRGIVIAQSQVANSHSNHAAENENHKVGGLSSWHCGRGNSV